MRSPASGMRSPFIAAIALIVAVACVISGDLTAAIGATITGAIAAR